MDYKMRNVSSPVYMRPTSPMMRHIGVLGGAAGRPQTPSHHFVPPTGGRVYSRNLGQNRRTRRSIDS